jgi:hypothetical protein
MSDKKETVTQTSGLNNSQLNTALSTIGSQLNTELGKGAAVFDQSMYPGMSDQTKTGVDSLYNNPNNAGYSSAVGDTLGTYGAIASGKNISDPTTDLVRSRLMNDATTAVNSSYLTDGRFGSSGMQQDSADAVVGALAPFDYSRQNTAAQMMPQLYQASQLPATAQLTAGQITDADALATRQGDADLFDRTNNAGWNTLARGTQILSGTAPSAGMTGTTTQSTQVPWWQTALGLGATAASFL